ncbi:MAG: prepilin-type N-terminal cleavage/methylation domain-containing protein [Sedimentisphaerales bacterium]|nr:prepilin-type N-terminal cleavage/methylation domain-containing protein [Sedimentisphaerales bacterium]
MWKKNKAGFTLIELLVVIAVIALLLSVLIPALKRAKEAGKRSLCLYNTKSLATAWTLYVQENDGRFPKAFTADDGWIRVVTGYPTNPEQAPVALQIEALEEGLLFPYLETTAIFRCPVAKKDELRTYSMTHALSGVPATEAYGGTILSSMHEIKNTGNRIVFLDDFIRDWDACWMVYNDRPQWWNTTPIRHGSGGNVFSFADTHSEFWSWSDQRTIDLAEKCYEDSTPEAYSYPESIQPDNPDLERIQTAVWGKLGYSVTP